MLRTYFLLYPSMDEVFSLRDEQAVAAHARSILDRTSPSIWGTLGYMPKTRDLSASRRNLLQAWCRKVLAF